MPYYNTTHVQPLMSAVQEVQVIHITKLPNHICKIDIETTLHFPLHLSCDTIEMYREVTYEFLTGTQQPQYSISDITY